MTENRDIVEFSTTDARFLLRTRIVPPVGALVGVDGKTYVVRSVSYTLGHAGEPDLQQMRVAVFLEHLGYV